MSKIILLLILCLSAASLTFVRAQDIDLTGYTLAFDDEFNSLSLSSSSPKGSANWFAGPANGATGNFSSSNWNSNAFTVSNGIMSDEAWYADPAINGQNWQSGLISSVDTTGAGFSQKYGYFEIRCQMPNAGDGAWPAFWLDSVSGINHQQNEEIDIFEWYGITNTPGAYQPLIQQASHNWTTSSGQDNTAPTLYSPQTQMPKGAYPWAGYHVYGCQVDPTHLTWYIDGVQTNQIATPTAYINTPFYVMVDYALGGGWPLTGSPLNTHGSSSLLVDWVRVYSLPGGGTTSTPPPTTISGNTSGSIGIQFQGSGSALEDDDSAGLSTVAQANWNVLTGSSFDDEALSDNSGAATSATLNGSADGTYFSLGSTATPAGNAKLASGELFNSWPDHPDLTVSAIPYATYDVYVYAGIDAAGRSETVSLTPAGGNTQSYSFTTTRGNSAWVAATSTWNGTGAAPSLASANYVHFTGLTSNTFTLNWGAPGNGGLNGIQIVSSSSGTTTTPPTTPTPPTPPVVPTPPPVTTPTPPPVSSSSAPIGIQFQGSGKALASTDSAGLAAVAQTNWNVLAGSAFNNAALSDSSGATTGVTLSGGANGGYFSFGSTAAPAGNAKLASGELYNGWPGQPNLTVSNIPYATYDVYIYAGIDAGGRTQTVSLTPAGAAAQAFSFITTQGNAAWVAATSAWSGTTPPSSPTTANYVHYTGLSGSSFTLSWGAPGNGGLNGIQIVPTSTATQPTQPTPPPVSTPTPTSTDDDSVGIQFQGLGTSLGSTDSAGLSSVSQDNWNVLTGSSFNNVTLSDSAGVNTGITLNGAADGGYFSLGSTATPAGNNKLTSGELYNAWPNHPSLTVSNIPYTSYDVYVYAGIDAAGRSETVSLAPEGGSTQSYSFTTARGEAAWVAATSTWDGLGNQPSLPSANYVHFTDLSASSFTLSWGAPGNGGLNGIQIVPNVTNP